MSLTPDSTLKEVFDFVHDDEHDVRVLPVTLTKKNDKIARMMILITGKTETANHIMANLMTTVQEMYDLAEQHAASKMVDSTGEKLTDDVKLVIP